MVRVKTRSWFWPGLLDWRNQTLTPNADVTYVMPFVNTLAATTMLRVCVVLPPILDRYSLMVAQPPNKLASRCRRSRSARHGHRRHPGYGPQPVPADKPTLHDPADATGGSFPAAASAEAFAIGLPRHRPASRLHHRTAHHQLTVPRQRPSLRAGRRRNRDALGRPAAVGPGRLSLSHDPVRAH